MWLAIFIFAENNINQNNVLVKIAALNKLSAGQGDFNVWPDRSLKYHVPKFDVLV